MSLHVFISLKLFLLITYIPDYVSIKLPCVRGVSCLGSPSSPNCMTQGHEYSIRFGSRKQQSKTNRGK